MEPEQAARTLITSPAAYEQFMGRYSQPLAHAFAATIPLRKGDKVLEVGSGAGALTGVLVDLLGPEAISVVDPSPPLLAQCLARYPEITGKPGRVEQLPWDDGVFDAVVAQLVLFFVPDLPRAGAEIRRVLRPGGIVAANNWELDTMEMMTLFWDAAMTVTGEMPEESRIARFATAGDVSTYFASIGLVNVTETKTPVEVEFEQYDDLWQGYLFGIGPMGAWCVAQSEEIKAAIREQLFQSLGSPAGRFTLKAVAHAAVAYTPA